MKGVLLSIKPRYAEAIFTGSKTVEFRRVIFKKPVETVIVYSSSPVKRIIGEFKYSRIVKAVPHQLWEKYEKAGQIDEVDFFEYFKGKVSGYAICIEAYERYKTALDPALLIENFKAPQSFSYISGQVGHILQNERIESSIR